MDTMNLIQEICLAKGKFDRLPKWRFFAKKKALNNYENSLSKFKGLDVFDACNNMITFLISLDKTMITDIDLKGMKFTKNSLTMIIDDDQNVTYLPKNGIFDIQNSMWCYTIYKNGRAARHIKPAWEELSDKIKEKCIEVIIIISNFI